MTGRVRSFGAELQEIVQNRHVANADCIRKIQKIASEPLVQEPDAACMAAGRFVAIPCRDRFGSDYHKQALQDGEVEPLAFEHARQMTAQGRVRIAARRQDLPRAGIAHAMPGTDRQQLERDRPLQSRCIDQGTVANRFDDLWQPTLEKAVHRP